jgi:sec-independent protein translocase protein TatA
MPGWVGVRELVVLAVVLVLVFGARRLPELGRSLGRGAREFKQGLTTRPGGDES